MITQKIQCDSSGTMVTVKVVSPRQILVTPIVKDAEVYDEHGELIGLDYAGDFAVDAGSSLAVKRQKYQIQKIEKKNNPEQLFGKGYYLSTTTLNKSAMFVFPLLGHDRSYFRWNKNFMNCFIGTEDEGIINTIHLWYRYDASLEMQKFEEKLMSHPNYIGHRDTDKYHVLYEFSVPQYYMDDYHKLILGKYSRINLDAKERILEFHSSTKERPLGKILFREDSRRKQMEKDLGIKIDKDMDLHDPFYETEEIYYNSYIVEKSIL